MERRTRNWLLWITLLLVGATGLYFGIRYYRSRPQKAQYITQPVTRGEISQVVNATGVVQPVTLSPVGSQVSGIVWKIHADFNDPVKKGQVLLELDPALLQAAVAREEANVTAAEADIRKAEAQLVDARLAGARAATLFEKNYISAAERDTAVARQRQAEADVAATRARAMQARAALTRARLDLKNSVILSPVDGVVIARNVELGQAVAAQFQAPNLFTIAQDVRNMQVLANVDEADIGMIRVGQSATFTVDAYRGRRFSAEVGQVRNAAQTVQNVVTYVVVLNVDNSDLLLKPGMTANVRMEVARREGALLLPNAALRFKPRVESPGQQGQGQRQGQRQGSNGARAGRSPESGGGAGPRQGNGSGKGPGQGNDKDGPGKDKDKEGLPLGATRGTVYVQEGDGLKPVPVVVGITDGTQTELIRGLSEGDQVIVDTQRTTPSGGGAGSNPFSPAPMRGGRRGF